MSKKVTLQDAENIVFRSTITAICLVVAITFFSNLIVGFIAAIAVICAWCSGVFCVYAIVAEQEEELK